MVDIETLLYYDGEKLQFDKINNIIYAWYDYAIDYEIWFKIKLDKENIDLYLSSKKSLYDILIEGETYLFKRNYLESFDYDFEKISDFSKLEMPTKDSFLNLS